MLEAGIPNKKGMPMEIPITIVRGIKGVMRDALSHTREQISMLKRANALPITSDLVSVHGQLAAGIKLLECYIQNNERLCR